MSVRVVFNSGKVVVYNEGGSITVEDGVFAVRPPKGKFLIARIPLSTCERIEFFQPCQVRWPREERRRKR